MHLLGKVKHVFQRVYSSSNTHTTSQGYFHSHDIDSIQLLFSSLFLNTSPLELNPDSDSPFGVIMITFTSVLMLAVILTGAIVIVNRDNIIIKSAR